MISLKILKIALLLVLIIFIFSKKNVFKKILLLITTTHYYLFTEDAMHIFGVYGKTIKKTGITWHMVKESIDTGDILVQKEIKLDNNCTALSLLNAQHKLALTLFREALEILKNKAFKMQISGGGYHKKLSLPNNGYLDLT